MHTQSYETNMQKHTIISEDSLFRTMLFYSSCLVGERLLDIQGHDPSNLLREHKHSHIEHFFSE